MRSRRGALSLSAALGATAFVYGALGALGGACGEFGVTGDDSDAAAVVANAPAPFDGAARPDGVTAADADAGPMAPDATCGMHDFCGDFEQAQPDTGWTIKHTSQGALAIADGGWPGNALSSSLDMTTASETNWAYVVKEFPGAMGLHVELEVNVPTTTLDPACVLTLVQFSGSGANAPGVGIVLSSSPTKLGLYIAHGDGTSNAPNTPIDLPRGVWVHLLLEMHFGDSTALLLAVDGATVFNQAVSMAVPNSTPELRIGMQHYNGPAPAVDVLFDTVRADVLP